MKSPYFIGIDGGGTNSRLTAIYEDMIVLGRYISGPINFTSEPYDKVYANTKNLLLGFNAQTDTRLSDCTSICVGISDTDIYDSALMLAEIFADIGFFGQLTVMSDAELVLAAETKGEPGIAIIAGTSSVGFALDHNGDILRVGGWGHLIDDGGSGYRMGMDAIKAALADFDCRGEKTALTQMITDYLGLEEIDQILEFIYGENFYKSTIAEIAMLVGKASINGDAVAHIIEIGAADYLISMARALIQKARLSAHKIVLSGNILLHNKNVHARFCQKIYEDFPNMHIVRASAKPEMGAAYMAYKYAKNPAKI